MAETPEDAVPPIRTGPSELAAADATVAELAEKPRVAQPPVRIAELLLLVAIVAVCDLTIYRGGGYAGLAVALFALPVLLWLASTRRLGRSGTALIGLMLLCTAGKLIWSGSALLVTCGGVLLVAFSMTLSGVCPFAVETLVFASQTVIAGYEGLILIGKWLVGGREVIERVTRFRWLNIFLPAITFLLFGGLFVLANPDLLATFGDSLEKMLNWLRYQLLDILPQPLEVVFWAGVFWISVGLLRPIVRNGNDGQSELLPSNKPSTPAPLFTPFRNTLVTVIVLFAIYLVFEFVTLWIRDFPPGFYYAGYAHEGAAWLTLALALATVILSLVFRGSVNRDQRLRKLQRLAWIWSFQNLLLAAAVYNRLFIYIGFNGMSRMRILGLFGMTAVVAGFALVLWKIRFQKNFVWLVRRQLWALALTIYLFALTPLDAVVVRYNVRRVLAGDLAPAVQISVQPINAEGIAALLPLTQCDDPIISRGVQAILAERFETAIKADHQRRRRGWTASQLAETIALRKLRQQQSNFWPTYQDLTKRAATKKAFDTYVYQWY